MLHRKKYQFLRSVVWLIEYSQIYIFPQHQHKRTTRMKEECDWKGGRVHEIRAQSLKLKLKSNILKTEAPYIHTGYFPHVKHWKWVSHVRLEPAESIT